ncbi:MAG: hypothetical protein WCD53_23965, partial [Microcoleus sp.]
LQSRQSAIKIDYCKYCMVRRDRQSAIKIENLAATHPTRYLAIDNLQLKSIIVNTVWCVAIDNLQLKSKI